MARKVRLQWGLLVLLLLWAVPVADARDKAFTVVIDAGHGGKDPGARGTIVDEKEINLAVALKLGAMIEGNHRDVRVVYTRRDDRFIELDERANIANRNKADLFISIHTNSVARRNSSAHGTETYTLGLARNDENLAVAMRENAAILLEDNYQQRYEGFDPNSSESYIIFEFIQNKHVEQSIRLASEVQTCFAASGRSNRGVRQAGFLVLRKTGMPSILVELGYITNREEERYLKSDRGRRQLATAIYNAFTTYKRGYDRKLGVLSGSADAAPMLQYVAAGDAEEEAAAPIVNPSLASPAVAEKEEGVPVAPPGSEADILARKRRRQVAADGVASRPQANQPGKGEVIYKIQILTAPRRLPAGSKRLKGYKGVDYYVEKGVYKYTYGASSDFNAIRKLRRQLLKDFKDAFIVAFRDGEKVTY